MTHNVGLTGTEISCDRAFCSLRLSVRTPPFHGGESGSIPLGSANTAKLDLPDGIYLPVFVLEPSGMAWQRLT